MSNIGDNPYSAPNTSAPASDSVSARPGALFYKRNELREMTWKVLAVILCVKLADYIAWVGQMASTYTGMAWSIVPIAAMVWFIGYSYFQSRRFHATPDSEENTNEVNIGILAVLQRVLFSVIGVYLIATQLSGFIVAAFHVYRAAAGVYWPATWVTDGGSSIAFMAGFFLFFGANSLSRLWFRIRSFGT